jgi:hypothetical protein
MSEAQREAVRSYFTKRRRRSELPEADFEYNPLAAFDEQVDQSFHRKKP